MSIDRDDSAGRRRDDKAAKAESATSGRALIGYICVDETHLRIGRDVADGHGYLTVHARSWAYCSAARPEEPHDWRPSGGVALAVLQHKDLERFRRS